MVPLRLIRLQRCACSQAQAPLSVLFFSVVFSSLVQISLISIEQTLGLLPTASGSGWFEFEILYVFRTWMSHDLDDKQVMIVVLNQDVQNGNW